MLIDRATVEVRAGKGGDGAISFLHDKNTEFGGPDGGNGGRGGSIYFLAAEDVNSLFAFKHSRVFIAPDGGKGRKTLMHGKDGEDVIVGAERLKISRGRRADFLAAFSRFVGGI